MTVMRMLTASILLEVTTAAVTLAMREMDSTAQVIHLFQSCDTYRVVPSLAWLNCGFLPLSRYQ